MDRDRLLEINAGAGAPGGLAAEPDEDLAASGRRLPGTTPEPVRPPVVRGGTGGLVEPTSPVTPAMRQRVQAAVSFHIGGKAPGIEWTKAVDPITDRFLEMAATNPALVAAVEQDVNAMFALTDMDIAERVMRGESVSQFGDVFDAIGEVAWEVGATDLAARLEAEQTDAIKGTFDALTQVQALQLGAADPTGLSRFTRFDPRGSAKAQTFQTLFDVPGAWSYSPTSGVLAVTVGEQTVGVRARPGFDPESHLDVMAEVVAAQADGRIVGGELDPTQRSNVHRIIDRAHQVGAWVETRPWARETVDVLWEGVTADAGDVDMARRELEAERANVTEESLRLASVVPFPEDATIAAVARLWMRDNPGLESQDALTIAAEAVAENRDQFVSEFEQLTQDQLVADLETELEGESPVGRAIEQSLQNTLQVFETWDTFAQTVGVNFIDFVSDFVQATEAGQAGDWEGGFTRLQAMFDAPEPSEGTGEEFLGLAAIKADDYFDLEGGAADLANLAVGGIFDPLNFVLPGAKGIRSLAQRALTNPKYASVYLRMGRYPAVINQIAGTTRRGARRAGLDFGPEVVDEARAARQALNESGVPLDMTVGEAEAVYGVASPEAAAVRRVAEAPPLEGDGLGAVLDVDGVRVDQNAAKAVRNVGAMSGFDDDEIIELVGLALDPNSTPDQVREVMARGFEKLYLGEGPGRAIRHSTVEGVGRALESIAAGKLSDEFMGDVMQMVAKLSVGRTFRLGENQALDNFADLLTQFFPADKDKFATYLIRAAQRRAEAGDPLAQKGAAALQKEAARRAAHESGGAIRSINMGVGGDLRGVQQNLSTIEETLANLPTMGLDEATEAGLRESLERTHAVMGRRAAEASPKIAEQQARKRAAHKKLKSATWLENDVANSARNNMAGIVYELYDDIARQINAEFGRDVIPVVKGKINPLAPDVDVRDWSEVTGVKKLIADDDPDLSLMMGLSVDDADIARGVDAVGMFNRSQKVLLPASPYEVLLFQKLGKDKGLMSRATRILRNEYLKKVTKNMKLVFAFNLLVNPLTAGKITLDETMRFLADTGEGLQFLRATLAGMPGVGRGSEAIVQKINAKFGSGVVNPYGHPYRRNAGGFNADDYADYGWVERPGRRTPGFADYRGQVERWVNGTLLEDLRFREYARWVDEATVLEDGTKIAPPGFVDWWENGTGGTRPGKADARSTQVTIRGTVKAGDELTGNEAFNLIDNAFNHWLDMVVDEGQRGSMRRTLVQAGKGARGKLDLNNEAHLLNAVSQVPGLSGKTGPASKIFNVFFGAPSSRRAGVFYEFYYDEAFRILSERHAGKIITPDTVIETARRQGIDMDMETAQFRLKQGADDAIVSQLIRDTGAYTEAHLAAKAAQYAERRADDLMYRFTSSSLVGRGVESALVLPFARAQVDFLSWWTDHMTKPLNLFGRLPLEARAKLPGAVQGLMNTVDRIPINLRAWSRYSHLVATSNNDQDSWVDQTINNLTFFPTRYDSEFLLDVSPQLGPLPAWLFDIAVDKFGDEEWMQEVAANFESLFPALTFTEYEGDMPGDIFNRLLPNSRRSIRDMTVGMMRAMYALGGGDIHTDPGLMGQIANFIADGKIPAATGDFQAAAVSDMLKLDESGEDVWSLVPGSDAWNRRIAEVAVTAAADANRQEWGQDMMDRVFPLAQYDAEYRALRAYEGMFNDAIFGDMVRAGIFQANDLLEVDGKPRIKEMWDRYQEGQATPDELAFLDDRLTTAYFEAGRHEVLPGFSFLDYINLTSPEVAVNLINKSEDSGIPVRNDDHAEFKRLYVNQITGRLQNVPPGDTGREIISEARRRGWLVSRPVEEWAFDAGAAVYKSGARALHGVWEWVSHRTWTAGLKKSIEDKTFVLPDRAARILDAAGLSVEAGTEFSYKEFHELLTAFDERFELDFPTIADTLRRGTVHSQLARHDDEFGLGLIANLEHADREFSKIGIESVEDWPAASTAEVRRLFGEAISLGYTTLEDYRQEIEPIFGPIDYQPPAPPSDPAELEAGLTLSGDELADMEVIDGDTVSVLLSDGPMRVRFVGINAPEVTQDGYSEARDNLARLVADADEVVLGVYKPELFGLTQLSAPGERRLLAWLYVDGVPIYSPDVFTADNPRGAGTGGSVLDLDAIMEANR